jgi:hypothetical protein
MLAFEFFSWWYGRGWRDAAKRIGKRINGVTEAFSVGTLLRTLFSPWRRIVTVPGKGVDAMFRAALDNAVSRFIGFLVRLMALLAAGLMLFIFGVFGGLFVILWPLLPLLSISLIIWGILP